MRLRRARAAARRGRPGTAGFTILEIVVVIAILAIMATIGWPKFAAMMDQSREATFLGMRGRFETSVMVIHANWLSRGSDPSDLDIPASGGTVRVNAFGWPDFDAGGASPTITDPEQLYEELLWGAGFPAGWSAGSADGGSSATYTLDLIGRSFKYDSQTGQVE